MACAVCATSTSASTERVGWARVASLELSGAGACGIWGACGAPQLRPGEGGQHDIPPTEIVPTGEENYAAIQVFARYVLDNPLRADANTRRA